MSFLEWAIMMLGLFLVLPVAIDLINYCRDKIK